MNLNKLIVLITIFALTLSIIGCSSSTPAPEAPAASTEAPATASAPATDAPVVAFDQVFVDNVTPKLQAMVDASKLTTERMQEIIAKIKTGQYQKAYVQKILSGEER